MSDQFAIKFDPEAQIYRVSGELSLASAPAILKQTDKLFDGRPSLEVDLAEVTRSDSASLALLIHWMRQVKAHDGQVRFHNLPGQMLAIARASGLDEFLPLQ